MKNFKFIFTILIFLISIIFFIPNAIYAVSQNSFLNDNQLTVSEFFSSTFSDEFKKTYLLTKPYKIGNKIYTNTYSHIQSLCTDGGFFYIACLTDRNETSTESDKRFIYQETTILKIRIKDKKIVASAYLGQIGHSNSLAYNNVDNTILIAPCNQMR